MLRKKQDFPEEGELVMCTITKVLPNSVFATLNEYDNKSGMIHISEVSPGRIRNIRDFVVEGKVIVCKVLKIDKQRGYIDLSLRRVNENQRKNKVNDVKLETKAEKIVEFCAKKLKKDVQAFFDEISPGIFKKYDGLSSCFMDVINKGISLGDLGIKKEHADALEEQIRERIKPVEVEIKGVFDITTYIADGVEIIKNTLIKFEKQNAELSYVGAGKYKVKVIDSNYKDAEKSMDRIRDGVIKELDNKDIKASFNRV